ncbi:MAG: hypothetical protein M3Q57_01045 [Pseudomonadota bacterium]|nr:hypothetical protein [Pseudomonadota bacterium]
MTLLAAAGAAPEQLNPRALEFVRGDSIIEAWALARFDRNQDGWLTLYEAQAAVDEFRAIADADRDGQVTPREYEGGVAFIKARY